MFYPVVVTLSAYATAWRDRTVVAVAALVAPADHQGCPQHVPLFSRDRQGTSVPSSTGVPRCQLLKVFASSDQFSHHCAVRCKACRNR